MLFFSWELFTRLVTVCAQSLSLLHLLHTKEAYWRAVILPEWKRCYSWTEGGGHFVFLQTPQAAGESDILLKWPEHGHILTISQRKICQSGKQAHCQHFSRGVRYLLLCFGVCSLHTCAGLFCHHFLVCFVSLHTPVCDGLPCLFHLVLVSELSSCRTLSVFCLLSCVDLYQHPCFSSLFLDFPCVSVFASTLLDLLNSSWSSPYLYIVTSF